jgi:hypothetical protein
MDKQLKAMLRKKIHRKVMLRAGKGGDFLGSVIKKRRKKMRKHKHKKLLAKTRHQRRSK